MALFSKKNSENKYIEYKDDILIKTPTTGSVLSKCMIVDGNIKSCEPITLDGVLNGDIICEDIVIVSLNSFVRGNIEAKEIRVDGKVKGDIKASIIELTAGSYQDGKVCGDIITVNGNLNGDILCKESLEIGKDATVNSYNCEASTIIVEGRLRGVIKIEKVITIGVNAKVIGKIEVKQRV